MFNLYITDAEEGSVYISYRYFSLQAITKFWELYGCSVSVTK